MRDHLKPGTLDDYRARLDDTIEAANRRRMVIAACENLRTEVADEGFTLEIDVHGSSLDAILYLRVDMGAPQVTAILTQVEPEACNSDDDGAVVIEEVSDQPTEEVVTATPHAGGEPIQVRPMYGEPVDLEPDWKIEMSGEPQQEPEAVAPASTEPQPAPTASALKKANPAKPKAEPAAKVEAPASEPLTTSQNLALRRIEGLAYPKVRGMKWTAQTDFDVVKLMSDGKTVAEVSEELGIPADAVKARYRELVPTAGTQVQAIVLRVLQHRAALAKGGKNG